MQTHYPPNGEVVPAEPTPSRRPTVRDVAARHQLPDHVVTELADAFGRAATRTVDDIVAGHKTSIAYYLVRRLDGETWWRR